MIPSFLRQLLRRLPIARRTRQRVRRLVRPAKLGTIRRTTPLSNVWGNDRGTPIDRYYIERFLDDHRQDIHGRILEVGDTAYTDRFGVNVESRDVLDIDSANRHATIVADLAAADAITSDQFDCFLLIQTLQYIYNLNAAVRHAHRILRPGGVLLATLPAVNRTDPVLTDYWRFTVTAATSLFGEIFGIQQVNVRSYGNVLIAIAFLTGMASEELSSRELNENHELFPVLIGVRAVKR